MRYISVKSGDIPGTVVTQEAVYAEAGGNYYPVIAMQSTEKFGLVPVLNIPQMSDYQWKKCCLESRLAHPERYAKIENVVDSVARLRKWLMKHGDGQHGETD